MKISWVISDTAVVDPTVDLDSLKNIGPFWAGWRTWRSFQTDNVICHNESDVRTLISKNFHRRCNLYISNSVYQSVDRPEGVKLYQGEFHEMVEHPDEIVSMHLASSASDIVLLLGFDFGTKNLEHDRLAKHKWHNYKQYALHIFAANSSVQWVLLDHPGKIDKELEKVSNIQFDTLDNVLSQFAS
jgi:hypothetical protein